MMSTSIRDAAWVSTIRHGHSYSIHVTKDRFASWVPMTHHDYLHMMHYDECSWSIMSILRLRPCRRPLLLLACSFLDVFWNISADTCAGSLMSGCSFDSHVFQFTVNWGADVVIFGAQNMSFGMFVASNLALGDHRAMLGDLGAHGRIPWGSRLGCLLILAGFRSRHLDVFGQFWNTN